MPYNNNRTALQLYQGNGINAFKQIPLFKRFAYDRFIENCSQNLLLLKREYILPSIYDYINHIKKHKHLNIGHFKFIKTIIEVIWYIPVVTS